MIGFYCHVSIALDRINALSQDDAVLIIAKLEYSILNCRFFAINFSIDITSGGRYKDVGVLL